MTTAAGLGKRERTKAANREAILVAARRVFSDVAASARRALARGPPRRSRPPAPAAPTPCRGSSCRRCRWPRSVSRTMCARRGAVAMSLNTRRAATGSPRGWPPSCARACRGPFAVVMPRTAPRRRRRHRQPEALPARALGAGPALLGQCVQVVVEVDLDRVALGGDVALAHRGRLVLDVLQQRRARRQRVLALEVVGDPLRPGPRPAASSPPAAAAGRRRSTSSIGMEDAAEELDVVVGRRDEVRVEEREGDLVAGAVDDHVDVARVPSLNSTVSPSRRRDFGLGAMVPWAMRSRMRPETVGWASPNCGRAWAARSARGRRRAGDQRVDHALADLERDAGVLRQLVGRSAEHVLGDDPRPAAGGQVGLRAT